MCVIKAYQYYTISLSQNHESMSQEIIITEDKNNRITISRNTEIRITKIKNKIYRNTEIQMTESYY